MSVEAYSRFEEIMNDKIFISKKFMNFVREVQEEENIDEETLYKTVSSIVEDYNQQNKKEIK